MRIIYPIATIFLLLFQLEAIAQPDPRLFRSLQVGLSAREAALGGRVLAIEDADINLAFSTPSLAGKSIHNQLAFNYLSYFSDIGAGYLTYGRELKNQPLSVIGGIRYFNYGEFIESNELFQETGQFGAKEIILQGGLCWTLDSNLRAGIQLKYINSNLERLRAQAILSDASLTYYNPKHLFGVTAMISNVGFLISDYNGQGGRMPFDLSIGISKKLAKSPLRFHLVADNLQRWDLSYSDPTIQRSIDPLSGQAQVIKEPGMADKLFRHIYGGTEIVLSKNFHLRFGYNYRRRQELKMTSKPGGTGISYGFSFRINRFHLAYARSIYHLGGASNHFTLSTNLSTFGKN